MHKQKISEPGFTIITIPKNPNKTANHLHGPALLPNNGTESAVRKMGVAKLKLLPLHILNS